MFRSGLVRSQERRAVSGLVVVLVAVIAVAAVAAGLYLSMGSGTPSSTCSTPSSQASAQAVAVSIYSGAANSNDPPGYAPDTITLIIGINNTVTWTNDDSVAHTVTSTSSPACGQFDSGRMGPGGTFSHTFTIAGTYEYHCFYHSWMVGTIIVKVSS